MSLNRVAGDHTAQGTSTTTLPPPLLLVQLPNHVPECILPYGGPSQNKRRVLIDTLAFLLCHSIREPDADAQYDNALMYLWGGRVLNSRDGARTPLWAANEKGGWCEGALSNLKTSSCRLGLYMACTLKHLTTTERGVLEAGIVYMACTLKHLTTTERGVLEAGIVYMACTLNVCQPTSTESQ